MVLSVSLTRYRFPVVVAGEKAAVPESRISPALSPQMATRANISGWDMYAGYSGLLYNTGNRKDPE